MLDFSHLPQAGGIRLDVLVGRTNAYVWTKPRNCSFVYLLGIGAGGGGGGGSNAASGAVAGGGGGASGGVGRILIPAMFLPDSIAIVVGVGGAAGASAGNGAAGTQTMLYFQPGIVGSSWALGHGGTIWINGGGAGLANGTGGTGSTANIPDAGYLLTAGLADASAGISGRTSSTTATPTAMSWAGLIVGGGAGAGTPSAFTAFNGGNVNYFSRDSPGTVIQTIAGGAGGNGVAGGNGNHGFSIIPTVHSPYSILCTGGAGGGNSTLAGGAGGNGGYGCGGGGGGARQGATSGGGVGGRGGDGVVFIWSF